MVDLTNPEDVDWMAEGRKNLTAEERRRLGYDVEEEQVDADEKDADTGDEVGWWSALTAFSREPQMND